MEFTPRSEQEIADSKTLPKGVYHFEVLDAWDKTSQKGNPMIELKLRVSNGNGEARTLTDYLLPQRPDKLRHAVIACGLDYDSGHLADSDFHGKQGRLRLIIEKKKGYAPRNVVEDYIYGETGSEADFATWSKNISR